MKTIDLSFKLKRPILACGADLKGAFALAAGNSAFLFDGFGDLSEAGNFTRYEKAIKNQEKRLKITPGIIACDLHPGYFSTQFAESYQPSTISFQLCKIQHHKAHIASAIADGGVKADVIGVAFDGAGYGSDGNIWGGEFFVGRPGRLKRAAHFDYVPMPGGDAAVRQPWRMALSYLYRAFGRRFLDLNIDFVRRLDKRQCAGLKAMIDKSLNSPLSSSAGRLFDAVGSIVLSKNEAAFEAELPVELEKTAIELCQDRYGFDVKSVKGILVIDFSRTVRGIVKDLSSKVDASTVSSKFHNTIASMISEVAVKLRKKFKTNKVIMSGGVFQNRYLSARAGMLLKRCGFDVYEHSKVSTNDSGIPLGQVAIANAMMRGRRCA